LLFAILCFGELKSGLITFCVFGFQDKFEVDFSDLTDDSSYNTSPLLEVINVDFIFSNDTIEAPSGMAEFDKPVKWNDDSIRFFHFDSAVSFYDSIINNNEITINGDYKPKHELQFGYPVSKSVKIITFENRHAYLIPIIVIVYELDGIEYDCKTFYWAYDSDSVSSTNIKEKYGKNKYINLGTNKHNFNAKGQKTNVIGKWNIHFKH